MIVKYRRKIETFIQARNAGAVTWGCTGVLNFDGNTNLKQKASYESIWQHLEEVNKHKFIFGSVISFVWPRIREVQQTDA